MNRICNGISIRIRSKERERVGGGTAWKDRFLGVNGRWILTDRGIQPAKTNGCAYVNVCYVNVTRTSRSRKRASLPREFARFRPTINCPTSTRNFIRRFREYVRPWRSPSLVVYRSYRSLRRKSAVQNESLFYLFIPAKRSRMRMAAEFLFLFILFFFFFSSGFE